MAVLLVIGFILSLFDIVMGAGVSSDGDDFTRPIGILAVLTGIGGIALMWNSTPSLSFFLGFILSCLFPIFFLVALLSKK